LKLRFVNVTFQNGWILSGHASYVLDFLLYTVIRVCICFFEIFYIKLVFCPSWINGMYGELISKK
jgi:hypothetical protein